MKNKKLKLKRWASAAIYLSLTLIVFVSMLFVSNVLDNRYQGTYNLSYILKTFINDDLSVINYNEDKIVKPFTSETVTIDKNYYEKDGTEEEQEKSLILYENTYMPNTGILYTSQEQFDVVATLEGKVTKVGKEELLGNVIEVTHSNNLVTTYYSVDNIKVIEGQSVKSGDILATSGKNNISSTSDNMLLFEVSLNGNNINPEKYYTTDIKDLK